MNNNSSSECSSFINHHSTNDKGLNKMTKSQNAISSENFLSLENNIKSLDRDQLLNEYHSLLEENLILKEKLINAANLKDGRKSQVLALLKEYNSISILEIANKLSISTKNVSSQLTYLRSDGYKIFTDHNGRKLLVD